MEVELLVVSDCPHERPAYDLVMAALAELNDETSVATTVITNEADARSRNFIGSPTFLVNGSDPFAEMGAPIGVACRVYRTCDGLAGLPSRAELLEALRRETTD